MISDHIIAMAVAEHHDRLRAESVRSRLAAALADGGAPPPAVPAVRRFVEGLREAWSQARVPAPPPTLRDYPLRRTT